MEFFSMLFIQIYKHISQMKKLMKQEIIQRKNDILKSLCVKNDFYFWQ